VSWTVRRLGGSAARRLGEATTVTADHAECAEYAENHVDFFGVTPCPRYPEMSNPALGASSLTLAPDSISAFIRVVRVIRGKL
jgi:hypothetical protein